MLILHVFSAGDYLEGQVVSISSSGCVPPALNMMPGMNSVFDGTGEVSFPISKLKSATKHTNGEQIKHSPESQRRKTRWRAKKNWISVGIMDRYIPRTTPSTQIC